MKVLNRRKVFQVCLDCDTVSLTNVFQAGGCLGQDRRLPLCNCWCANHRAAGASHRVQLQLLLPPGDGPGRDAVTELQSRDQLPVPSRYIRSATLRIFRHNIE